MTRRAASAGSVLVAALLVLLGLLAGPARATASAATSHAAGQTAADTRTPSLGSPTASGHATGARSGRAVGDPAPNPTANIAPSPAFPNSCYSSATDAACQTAVIQALDNARSVVDRQQGTSSTAYALPAGFGSLPVASQLLLLSNDDRAHYARTAITGLNASLDNAAQSAAAQDADPNGSITVEGQSFTGWSANWAGGLPNPLMAYYLWMYEDGPGGANADCTSTETRGCWGHRQDTLFDFGSSVVNLGVGAVYDPNGVPKGGYAPSFTELYWASAKPVSAVPVVTGVSPASGPVGSSFTVSGLGLSGASGVRVGSTAAARVTVAANGRSLTASAPSGTGVQAVTVSGPGGASTSTAAATFSFVQAAAPGAYVPVTPSRLLDTRRSSGPVAGGTGITVPVAGSDGVPSDATAAVLNVTVTAPTRPGFVTVYGSGAVPSTSNLNMAAGQTVSNLTLAPLSSGAVTVYVGGSGSAQLVVDVQGYVSGGGTGGTAGAVAPVTPVRALDTRHSSGPLAGGSTLAFAVDGVGAVPSSGVSAVVLNLTATGATRAGYLTAYADGTSRPATSNVNVSPGQTVPGLVLAPVGSDGKVAVYAGGSGAVQVIADVAGYVVAGTPNTVGALGGLAPARLLDTRNGTGVLTAAPYSSAATSPTQFVLAAHHVQALMVTGRGGVPTGGVAAVVLTVTATGATAPQFLAAYADGSNVPAVSNLVVGPGQTVSNLVVAPVGPDGEVDLYAGGSDGAVSVIADVSGYVLAAGS